MNYEQRCNQIGTLLREILRRYERPARFDDQTAREELAAMVKDLNSEWPVCDNEAFNAVAERFAETVRKTIGGRDWPGIPAMIKALREARRGALPDTAADGPALCEYEIAAARIHAQKHVGEGYVYGGKAKELVRRGLVTEDDLRAYRSAAYFHRVHAVGEEAARLWEADARARHEVAPLPTTEADLIEARKRRAER